MTPLREYAEKINRSWEGILDEPENHPRLVVRPPSGLLMVWFMDSNQERPDLVLDLSKRDLAPKSLDFWRMKARSGNKWTSHLNTLINREEFNPINSSWLIPSDFWDEIPQEIMEVRVRSKSTMDSSGICFTIRHIWVDTEHLIAQPTPDYAPTKYPVEEYRRMLFDLVREDWEIHRWQYGLVGRIRDRLDEIVDTKEEDKRKSLIFEPEPYYVFRRNNGKRQPVQNLGIALNRIKKELVKNGEVTKSSSLHPPKT